MARQETAVLLWSESGGAEDLAVIAGDVEAELRRAYPPGEGYEVLVQHPLATWTAELPSEGRSLRPADLEAVLVTVTRGLGFGVAVHVQPSDPDAMACEIDVRPAPRISELWPVAAIAGGFVGSVVAPLAMGGRGSPLEAFLFWWLAGYAAGFALVAAAATVASRWAGPRGVELAELLERLLQVTCLRDSQEDVRAQPKPHAPRRAEGLERARAGGAP